MDNQHALNKEREIYTSIRGGARKKGEQKEQQQKLHKPKKEDLNK